MATSTIWDAKRALIDRLQARPGLAGVQVTWAIPPGEPEPDWIYVGDAREPAGQSSAALGQQRREEHYILHVVVSVVRPFADDAETVARRAEEITAEIEAALRADASLDGVVRWALVVGLSLEEPADGKRREARVPMRIDVRQRI